MTEERHDKEKLPDMDEYLEGNSPVSKAYRELEKSEPPAALDRAVMQAARDELAANLLTLKEKVFWRHWMRPLSAVALMGVCLAVVLEVMEQQPQLQKPSALMKTDSSQAEELQTVLEQIEVLHERQETEGIYELRERLANAEESSVLATPAAKQQPGTLFADRSQTMAGKAAADSDVAIALDQVTVTARKSPAGGSSAMLEEIVVARRGTEKDEIRPVIDALDAWAAGARPAADVWLAGIQSFYAEGEVEIADTESAKLNRVFPGTTERARATRMNDDAIETEMLMSLSAEAPEEIRLAAIDVNDLPNPHIWIAGIEWLYTQNDEVRADAELEKFSRIYPDFDY
jgi:hypothetical protein